MTVRKHIDVDADTTITKRVAVDLIVIRCRDLYEPEDLEVRISVPGAQALIGQLEAAVKDDPMLRRAA